MIDEAMKKAFMEIDKDKRNEMIAAAFLLELELGRGSKTEEENIKSFIDYALCTKEASEDKS